MGTADFDCVYIKTYIKLINIYITNNNNNLLTDFSTQLLTKIITLPKLKSIDLHIPKNLMQSVTGNLQTPSAFAVFKLTLRSYSVLNNHLAKTADSRSQRTKTLI